jgi:drug/metabolite transporter (DMT)-like permease
VLVGFGSGLVAALIFLSFQRPDFAGRAIGWGLLAGSAQGLGWIAFASALDKAPMAVAAPAAATTTTVLLYVGGLILGTSVDAVAVVGLVVALVSLGVLGFDRATPIAADPRDAHRRRLGTLHAIAAGCLFAAQAAALVRAGTGSSALVLVGTCMGAVGLLALTLRAQPIPKGELKGAARAGVVGGTAIFGGDAMYLYALSYGAPVVVSVIAQLHPIVTATLATLLLRERPARSQIAGLVLAVTGVALIGLG